MTNKQRQPTTAELREMAQEALRMASIATNGPWFGVSNLEVQTTDVALAEVFDDGFDYDQALANAEFMGKSRHLVPDLATALIAALDRVDELEKWLKEGEKLSPDYEGTLVDNFPPGYHLGKRNMCYLTLKKIEELRDVDCPFCHHPTHADKTCKSCSCKTGVIK